MELKPGYKQTEVGAIPEHWNVRSLKDLATIQRGASPRPIDSPVWFDTASKVGWVRISDVTRSDGKYLTHTDDRLSVKGIASSRFLPSGTLIMSICATVGIPVITGIDSCIHDGFVGFTRLRLVDQEFLYYKIQEQEAVFRSLGQMGSQSNLNTDLVRDRVIALPPLPEQRAIATALSDVDTLLAKLDALIAKKRDIKQAAMQQLLTGKQRLPGFSGEWEVKLLGDVSAIKTGNRNNEDKVLDGQYPFFVRSQTVERIDSCSFSGEAILVPGEGGIGTIIHYVNGKFDYHQRVYKISNFTPDTCGRFVYYSMLHTFNRQATRNSVKATVDSLRLPTFLEFEMLAPTVEEQAVIATVLSDMDAEIMALEARREKTRALKQGMMQELLTGRIRLV